jgi:hypothetical protein
MNITFNYQMYIVDVHIYIYIYAHEQDNYELGKKLEFQC